MGSRGPGSNKEQTGCSERAGKKSSFADKLTLASLGCAIILLAIAALIPYPAPSAHIEDDEPIHPRMASALDGSNPLAPVTLIEFGDYTCPYTREQHPIIRQITTRYGDRLNYQRRHLPSPDHPGARLAATAAHCVGIESPADLESFESWVYSQQGYVSIEDALEEMADLSIDTAAVKDCMDDPSTTSRIQADIDLAAKEGVAGTPTLFIQGKPLRGVQPYAKLAMIIDSLIEADQDKGRETGEEDSTAENNT